MGRELLSSQNRKAGSGRGCRIQLAAKEILAQAARFDRWGTLALMDISLRYRRTVIGPLWITLTLAATIASVGTVYAALFRQDITSFLPHFAVGLIVWTLIATTLQEGSNIFVASNHLIKAVPAPLIVHVLQMMARNALVFAHHLVIVVLLYLLMPWPLHGSMLLAVPGFAILLTVLLGGSVALGMLCARFRDIGSAIVSGLQFVFFLTPIIWAEDSARGTAFSLADPRQSVRDAARSGAQAATVAVDRCGAMALRGHLCHRRGRHRPRLLREIPSWCGVLAVRHEI